VGAAGLAAIGAALNLAYMSADGHQTVTRCETVDDNNTPPTSESRGTILRTIQQDQIQSSLVVDKEKSERAFISAHSNGLFDSYNDGEEVMYRP